MGVDESIERARRRMRMAQEVIDWCRRARRGPDGERERTAAALELHHLHGLHARELGDEATAVRAEQRYDLLLEWHFGGRRAT